MGGSTLLINSLAMISQMIGKNTVSDYSNSKLQIKTVLRNLLIVVNSFTSRYSYLYVGTGENCSGFLMPVKQA